MLVNVFGGLGSGKTLFGVIMSYYAYRLGKNVFSNMKSLKFSEYIDLEKLLTYSFPVNAFVFLDEVYLSSESRMSISDVNVLFSHIVFQSRKKGLDILTTSQLKKSIDIRLRDLCDIEVYAFRTGLDFNYLIIYGDGYITRLRLPYSKAKHFFKFYDTHEIVESESMNMKRKKLLDKLKKAKTHNVSQQD